MHFVWISFELGFGCQKEEPQLPDLLCGLARPLFLVLEEDKIVHMCFEKLDGQQCRVGHAQRRLILVGERESD